MIEHKISEMTHDTTWTWTLDRTICSDPKLGVELIGEVREHLEQNSWGNKDVFGVHMALEEAVMNAIKHGNCRDAEKCVNIRVGANPEQIWIRIEDEGCGFDPDEVPDPTLEENLEKCTGRGVMLMRMYMDEVNYNPVGNVVELSKHRTGR